MDNTEIINRIHREYEFLRLEAEKRKNEEIKKAYKKAPSLKEIDEKINSIGLESMKKIMSNPQKATSLKKEFEEKIEKLKRDREEIIKQNNINPDYNKPLFKCNKCSDTGYSEKERCSCFEEKIVRENSKNSNLGNMILKAEFDDFSLDWYENKEKETVKDALLCSKEFSKEFENINYNLFFYGTTGLGKTYLSSIIANELLKNGKSVIYIRATKMFSDYQDYRFNDYKMKEKIDELYSCDLLVIDDLGSESTNKNDVSFLFDLINDRIINNKKIIINTNMEISDFTKVYSVRLTSRIYENFKIYKFSGEDIRIKKLMKK